MTNESQVRQGKGQCSRQATCPSSMCGHAIQAQFRWRRESLTAHLKGAGGGGAAGVVNCSVLFPAVLVPLLSFPTTVTLYCAQQVSGKEQCDCQAGNLCSFINAR